MGVDIDIGVVCHEIVYRNVAVYAKMQSLLYKPIYVQNISS